MGCGRGLTSEIIAATGSTVIGIDIDDKMTEYSQGRAASRSLAIKRITSNYDNIISSVGLDAQYDLALFCASLHHSTRPWSLLADIKSLLKSNGVIAIIEEPINELWWEHWGIRLDSESVYVAAKYGWFESGFSCDFLYSISSRLGMNFSLQKNIRGDAIGLWSSDTSLLDNAKQILASLGFLTIAPTKKASPIKAFDAQLDIYDVPNCICREEFFEIFVKVTNKSDQEWVKFSSHPVNLSYHWKDQSGVNLVYNGERTLLPIERLRPGESVKLLASVRAPNANGSIMLEMTLVQEGVAWFEDFGFHMQSFQVYIKN